MPDEPGRSSTLSIVVPLGLLLIVSGFFSMNEFSYRLRARRVTAVLDSASLGVEVGKGRLGGDRRFQLATYHFREKDGTSRSGQDKLPVNVTDRVIGGPIEVEYLEGRDGSSRVAGNGPKLMPATFIFCLMAFGLVGIVLAAERYRANLRRQRRARRHVQGDEEPLP